MFCKKCNHQLNDGAKFCKGCGTPVVMESVETPKNMFCKNCGNVIKTGSLFCKGCGARLEGTLIEPESKIDEEMEVITEQAAIPQPSPSPQPQSANKGKINKILIISGIIAIVVAVIVFFGIKIFNSMQEKNRIVLEQLQEERDRVARQREEIRQLESERQRSERRQKEERERLAREEEQRQQQAVITVSGVSFEMVFVEGGTFTMGCTGSNCQDNERPARQVTVSNFSIGKYEVTQAQWTAIMNSNPSNFRGNNLPVENVSWDDVQEFIHRLNLQTGRNFRLPTEAEWEYAARGGNQSQGYTYSGSNNIGFVAWYDQNSGRRTHPVGSKAPNELGIYDMTGNVWEWCSDWFGTYSNNAQTNPKGPASGTRRVDRGGGWRNTVPAGLRVSGRSFSAATHRGNNLGFRLAISQ